ncbi:MAG: sodium/glutamate symporter [Candidatus Marinimicrobia bacterium]|jgi:ESS family glutamate:Na+ symporter|nr:sodium/glutamate symporter [Candidatus Neomarinimicrobiota bacterium]
MNPWDLTLSLKDLVLDFTYLSAFLVVGTILRRYIPFFQKFLVPNNIIGGFIGWIISQQVLNLVYLDENRLGQYVYHLLALTFITLGLRQSKNSFGKGPVSKAFIELSTYILQGMIGLLVAFGFIYTVKPDLFAGIGFLLPLGFGMGPGIAYTMGKNWEVNNGFEGGAALGLTFAAIGFLIAYFVGVAIVNWGIRRRETVIIKGPESITNDIRTGIIKDNEPEIAGRLTLAPEAIEPLAFQVGLIGLVYMATYWLIYGIASLMTRGGLGEFTATLWSFHFIIALLVAVGVRKILDLTKTSSVIDLGLMNRVSGVCVDYLVVGSIVAISMPIVIKYWSIILIASIAGGLVTFWLLRYTSKRAFDDYHFERFVGIFGEMTGTINSGLVLIRIVDPEYRSPAAEDLAYGGGIALFIGFPLLILLNAPMTFLASYGLSGYWITFGLMFVYLVILWIVWRAIGFIKFRLPKKHDSVATKQ